MIGEMLGNYRIVARLGSGSMGVVFLAAHQRIVRRVAIKLLSPELVRDQQALQRFFNEALATSLIRHPGIVDVFDCDVDASGRAYMVMEHLEGETLGRRLERDGRLRWRDACLIARQAAEALGAAHDKGIVHRDLKPENLFLVSEPAAPAATAVKLLDFGVAKLLGHDRANRLTMRGMLVGTPEYMSPEQCAGAEIDHRADVYALGCILYEMLGGLPPFVADTVQELLTAHRFLPVPPLGGRDVAVPDWLADLLARMLSKEPGQRPSSMHEVAAALRAREAPAPAEPARDPVPAAPTEPPPTARRFAGRRSAIAFALASGLVLAGAIWRAQRKAARTAHATPAPVAGAEVVVKAEPAALPAVAATPPAEVLPVPPAAAAPLERRADRAARAGRPARPAARQTRGADIDGIVDL